MFYGGLPVFNKISTVYAFLKKYVYMNLKYIKKWLLSNCIPLEARNIVIYSIYAIINAYRDKNDFLNDEF